MAVGDRSPYTGNKITKVIKVSSNKKSSSGGSSSGGSSNKKSSSGGKSLSDRQKRRKELESQGLSSIEAARRETEEYSKGLSGRSEPSSSKSDSKSKSYSDQDIKGLSSTGQNIVKSRALTQLEERGIDNPTQNEIDAQIAAETRKYNKQITGKEYTPLSQQKSVTVKDGISVSSEPSLIKGQSGTDSRGSKTAEAISKLKTRGITNPTEQDINAQIAANERSARGEKPLSQQSMTAILGPIQKEDLSGVDREVQINTAIQNAIRNRPGTVQTIDEPMPRILTSSQESSNILAGGGNRESSDINQINVLASDLLEGKIKRRESEIGMFNRRMEELLPQSEQFIKSSEELETRRADIEAKSKAIEQGTFTGDYEQYVREIEQYNKDLEKANVQYQQLQSEGDTLRSMQEKLDTGNFMEFIYNLRSATDENIQARKQQDFINQQLLGQSQLRESGDLNKIETLTSLGTTGFWKTADLGRGLVMGTVGKPIQREISGDMTMLERFSPATMLARNIYDWKNPQYGVDWDVVKGVSTPLIGAGGAGTVFGRTLVKGALAGQGIYTGTKSAGALQLSDNEQKYVQDKDTFQRAMQEGYGREGASYYSDRGGVIGGATNIYKDLPGVQLYTGDVDEFSKGVRDYYRYSQGLSGKELEDAVNAAVIMRRTSLGAEAAGVLGANIASEFAGQKFLSNALRRGGMTSATKVPFPTAVKEVGKAGVLEGGLVEAFGQQSRYEDIDPVKIGGGALAGGAVAGTAGGLVVAGKQAVSKLGRGGGRALETGLNIADPYEPLGDVSQKFLSKIGASQPPGFQRGLSIRARTGVGPQATTTDYGRGTQIVQDLSGVKSFTINEPVSGRIGRARTTPLPQEFVKSQVGVTPQRFTRTTTFAAVPVQVQPQTQVPVQPQIQVPVQAQTQVPVQPLTQAQTQVPTKVPTGVQNELGSLSGEGLGFRFGKRTGEKTIQNKLKDITKGFLSKKLI